MNKLIISVSAFLLVSLFSGCTTTNNYYHQQPMAQEQRLVAQQQTAPMGKPFCSPGKEWKRLNWEGHPQHGKFVCLPDGDTHKFEGE